MSDDPKALCSNRKNHMSREITYVKPISYHEEDVGYVKDLVTYIVMDDLSIMPMSNIPTTTLLKKFNIKDMGTLEEKLITFNVSEVIYIYIYVIRTILMYNLVCSSCSSSICIKNQF